MKPFQETKISDNTFIREFSQNTDSGEMTWHRDRENRVIECIGDTDWMIQIDNELPKKIEGGSQERAVRGGTENIHSIVGLATALELAYRELEEHERHIRDLKAQMVVGLKSMFSDLKFNGDSDDPSRLYTVLNVSFPPHPKNGMALFLLDLEGIACSGGSACSSGATLGSHVLRALQFHDQTRASLRFSFGRYNTEGDIQEALAAIKRVFS